MAFFIGWLDISKSKFYDWQNRYGKVNEHNAKIPRDHWLTEEETQAIIDFYHQYPNEGYRRLTYMMLDSNIVAVSPSAVYRALKKAGLMKKWNGKESKKGAGFHQPEKPHEHWHTDISYINIQGTFYYMCSVLDGCSRYIVHFDILECMKVKDIQIIIQKALEKYPGVTPRIISDNGPQFIAKDFKEFIRATGMTHVRTSPYYPQSNGKLERYHKTIKGEHIRKTPFLSLEDSKESIPKYVDFYNNTRLHSAIGYITPKDKLEGRAGEIFKERDRKLEEAREARKRKRAEAADVSGRLTNALPQAS